MIPKVIGRPVYSYHLAAIGFWTYALFASWTGMQRSSTVRSRPG
jgi:cytochrome c oxidase cbb3-type subunit 1